MNPDNSNKSGCTAQISATMVRSQSARCTSVAWRAKPAVQASATHALNHAGLDGVLNLFNPKDA